MLRRMCLVAALVVLVLGGALGRPPLAGAVGVWAPAPAPPLDRFVPPVGPDDSLIFPAGQPIVIGTDQVARYDAATDRWAVRASGPFVPAAGQEAPAPLPGGKVLFTGGRFCPDVPDTCGPAAAAQVYDPAGGIWTSVAPMGVARDWHTATALPDGTVLVVGGSTSRGETPVEFGATAAVERYDPRTGRWSPAAALATPRVFHRAILLRDGRVLVVGGSNADSIGLTHDLASAEIYDLATDRWRPAAPMHQPRGLRFSATLLADGRVLVAGPLTATEVYDPVADRWTPAGAMGVARDGYTATLLPGGQVLVAGGGLMPNSTSAELYDPTANRWVGAVPLTTPRAFQQAIVLPDGRVLVAGGNVGAPTAETYTPNPAPEACFAATGHCVRGPFLQYWRQHGGLAVNGYPLSDEFVQVLEDGKPYTVQYFERVRMEYHPENPPPYDVELGQFGRRILQETTGRGAAPPAAPIPGQAYFAPTGHNVDAQFMAYWTANGGLAQFGYPLTEAFQQQLEDGKTYTVQYFERARFEAHPENQPPYDVELGQFGRRILAER